MPEIETKGLIYGQPEIESETLTVMYRPTSADASAHQMGHQPAPCGSAARHRPTAQKLFVSVLPITPKLSQKMLQKLKRIFWDWSSIFGPKRHSQKPNISTRRKSTEEPQVCGFLYSTQKSTILGTVHGQQKQNQKPCVYLVTSRTQKLLKRRGVWRKIMFIILFCVSTHPCQKAL